MDIITGMDYRNGHYTVALSALTVFYLHKMYFWRQIYKFYLKPRSHGQDLRIRKFCMYANFAHVSKSKFCFAVT